MTDGLVIEEQDRDLVTVAGAKLRVLVHIDDRNGGIPACAESLELREHFLTEPTALAAKQGEAHRRAHVATDNYDLTGFGGALSGSPCVRDRRIGLGGSRMGNELHRLRGHFAHGDNPAISNRRGESEG